MTCPQKNKDCIFLVKEDCIFTEGCFPVVETCYTAGPNEQPCHRMEKIRFNDDEYDFCKVYRDPYIIWSTGCPLRTTKVIMEEKKINPLKASKRQKGGK